MGDTQMQDADAATEEEMMYGHGRETEEELAEKFAVCHSCRTMSRSGLLIAC